MMQNHIWLMELNRRYNCFDVLKVTEKKLPFSGGLTEYFPPNPQLVNHEILLELRKGTFVCHVWSSGMGIRAGPPGAWSGKPDFRAAGSGIGLRVIELAFSVISGRDRVFQPHGTHLTSGHPDSGWRKSGRAGRPECPPLVWTGQG